MTNYNVKFSQIIQDWKLTWYLCYTWQSALIYSEYCIYLITNNYFNSSYLYFSRCQWYTIYCIPAVEQTVILILATFKWQSISFQTLLLCDRYDYVNWFACFSWSWSWSDYEDLYIRNVCVLRLRKKLTSPPLMLCPHFWFSLRHSHAYRY